MNESDEVVWTPAVAAFNVADAEVETAIGTHLATGALFLRQNLIVNHPDVTYVSIVCLGGNEWTTLYHGKYVEDPEDDGIEYYANENEEPNDYGILDTHDKAIRADLFEFLRSHGIDPFGPN
jgi:hypothetical protein